mmetsp:Transcript_22136/g.30461  ORF Transcript_22136/g.30461 Transcript_22136/m.30461 type:complete len:206 (-) Transcript_22136:242-859(-)
MPSFWRRKLSGWLAHSKKVRIYASSGRVTNPLSPNEEITSSFMMVEGDSQKRSNELANWGSPSELPDFSSITCFSRQTSISTNNFRQSKPNTIGLQSREGQSEQSNEKHGGTFFFSFHTREGDEMVFRIPVEVVLEQIKQGQPTHFRFNAKYAVQENILVEGQQIFSSRSGCLLGYRENVNDHSESAIWVISLHSICFDLNRAPS